MGGSSGPPLDYQGLARQQGQDSLANIRAQTASNRPGTNTGFGSTSWTQTGPDSWSQNSSLNGPLGSAQGAAEQNLMQGLGQPLDSGVSARDNAFSAMYGAEAQQLDPQWKLNNELSQSSLANSGLSPTSEAARTQNRQMSSAENQAYSGALSNAQQAGNQAQQLTYQQNVQSQQIPLAQLQNLLGLEGQGSFSQAGLAATPDYLGAGGMQSNAQLQQQGMQNQAAGSEGAAAASILTGILSAAAMAA